MIPKKLSDRWRAMSGGDRVRFVVVVLMKFSLLPLQVIFYLLRSAWQDSEHVGMWMAPSCRHGIRPTEPCVECQEEYIKSEIDAAMRHHHAKEN